MAAIPTLKRVGPIATAAAVAALVAGVGSQFHSSSDAGQPAVASSSSVNDYISNQNDMTYESAGYVHAWWLDYGSDVSV
ncbi:hypothetical protein [Actinospica robiniae]|uniref:hypothetical protein n=1 Tax=Actinospica robiniae TaxID=304901 RepID=UPI0012F7F92C|nr:hypothetical protein [Actinospica robiniae]